MNTSFIAYGIDVVSDPDLSVLTGTSRDGAGQVVLQNGTQTFTDTQIVEVIVEQVEVDGELTGDSRIVGINVYDSKAAFEAATVLYSYETATAGDYASVQEIVAGMGDGYLQFDASMLVSSDTGAPVLSTLFFAPGTDANDGYGTLTLDNHSDSDLDGDGVIAAGTAEGANGSFNTGYSNATYAPPLAGDYVVEGGAGDDFIDPTYTGDPEGDRIDGNDAANGSNDDVIRAGGGDDTVLAGDGDDYIDGGSGHDQLEGGDGDDTMLGGTGDDRLYGGVGNDSAMGGEGADSFEAYDGNDYFSGGDGDDWMNGDKGDDTLLGGAGNDWMRASFGNDSMAGGTGDDYVWSGYGDDTITLENDFGNDTILMEDQDEVHGDVLDMSGVTDDLRIDLSNVNAGAGTVSDGTSTASIEGVEHLILGSGTDTVVLADFSGRDAVEGFVAPTLNADGSYSGHDRIDVSGLTDDDGNPVDVNDVTVSDDGSGNAVLSFPHGEALTLVGVAPADVSDAAQLVAMGIPGDRLDGIVEGGSGSELIDDSFTGDPDGDRVDGGDAIDPGAGADDDSIRAGYGNDTIRAGLGDDTIEAEFGDDWLEGGEGDDLLIGGLGGDTMFGEAGNDRFQISSGDTAMGGDGDDSFTVDDSLRDGGRFKIDGGADGETKGDTLYVNGPAHITYDASDPETGSVEWLDGSVLYFSDIENVVHVPCFTESSMIMTRGGEKAARDIRAGDMVLTRDNGFQPVRWAGTRELAAAELEGKPGLRPVLIRRGALGDGVPCRDLTVSPQHRMMIDAPKTALWFGSDEVFVAAIHLTFLDGVEQLGDEAVTYVHFMFDTHQVVQGDGCWSESFQPGDLSLLGMDEAQRNEIVSLFPQLMQDSADKVYPAARQTLSARETRVLFG
ncbi:Hint domain-containing protein [Thalassovita aquimarina]|uniref:Hint domain-containing protein n=1 Tax=Thalassovita aquimarina TaxID=2785917 RepID=UPI0035691E94